MSALIEIRYLLLCLGLVVAGCAPPPQSTLRGARETPPSAETAVVERGPSIVATARSQLGVPYRYGGGDSRGFDCSGLVRHVFRDHGLVLPRRSQDQYRRGTLVPPDDLRPGDLVFFAGSGGVVNHVGIWSGNGRFVHASRSRGVVEDSADSAWFRRRFVGARRLPVSTGK